MSVSIHQRRHSLSSSGDIAQSMSLDAMSSPFVVAAPKLLPSMGMVTAFSFSFSYKVDSSYLPIDVNVADPRNVEVMLYWIAMKAGVQ